MRRAILTTLALMLAVFAWCQVDMSEMSKMQSSPCMVMLRRDIRKELKLSRSQDTDVDRIEKTLSGAMQPSKSKDPDSLMAPYQAMKDANSQILATLDDVQKKRLSEIRLQILGCPAMVDPEFAPQVGLSEDQINAIKPIESAYIDDATQYVMKHHDKHTPDEIDKMAAARDVKILAILTQDQRDKFKQLLGTPFKNARPRGSIF